jgi:hypothetical protein
MPPSVIEYLNRIAEKQKKKISKDPIFCFGYDIQRYIEDNGVNIQANSDTEDVIERPSVFMTGVISISLMLISMIMNYLSSSR